MAGDDFRNRILQLVVRHKIIALICALFIGAAFVYGYTRRSKPFPSWEEPKTIADGSTALKDAATSAASADTEDESREAHYDPDDPKVDERYRLPMSLSTTELHQLILDMDCLTDLAKARDQLLDDYNRLYAMLTDPQVKEVFLWRIKNQKGFKEPTLPLRWHEFSEASKFSSAETWDTAYVNGRVERVRYRIIGGKYTAGDVKFVSLATAHYTTDIPKLADWIGKAKQLNQWMVEDQIVTSDTTIKTSLDGFVGPTELIASIRKAHADGASGTTSPQPIARVTPDSANQRGFSSDPLAIDASARKQLTVNFTAEQRAEFTQILDRVAQATTVDIRFVPPPPPKPKNPNDKWAYMDAELERQALAAKYPLLNHARDPYREACNKLTAGRERLFKTIDTANPDTAKAMRSLYATVVIANLAEDESREFSLAQLIRDLKQRDLTKTPITFDEVEKINSGDSWAKERLSFYQGQADAINRLLGMAGLR